MGTKPSCSLRLHVMFSLSSSDRHPTSPPHIPRRNAIAHSRGNLLPQPLLDHRLPRHQAEPHAVIKHGVASAGKHDGTPVDPRHAPAVGHRAMLEASFGGNILRDLGQFAAAQRVQQIAGEDDALAEFYQRVFGEDLPESAANLAITA